MTENEFNEKFLIHRRHAIGYFKKKFNFSNDEVEDFVQTAYLKIFKRFYNTNVDCEYPRQYLFNAVQNCIYEYVSRKNYVKKEESFTQLNIEHPTVFLDALNEIDSDLLPDNIIEKKTILKEIQTKLSVGANSIHANIGEFATGIYTLQIFENNKITQVSKVEKK